MNYKEFDTVKLTQNKMDIWIKFNMNVMLIGEKGVGKSSQIINAFDKNNLKWAYFSGATLDPWTDLIGIPKPITTEKGTIIEYVRPANLSDDIEAIFCDEFNRAHKKVKNALMELIQFKSINGRKFPNLRIVWAAINPDDEESNYDVETIDPAQLDRFHVIVNIPYEADKKYFTEKYTNTIGTQAVLWWQQQSDVIKKQISPRRLDYAVKGYLDGVDISDILPKTANLAMFRKMMNMNPTEVRFNSAALNNDYVTMESILNDDSSFQEIKKFILGEEKFYIHISTLMHNEKLSALFKEFKKFSDWVRIHQTIGKNKEILDEINKTQTFSKTSNMHADINGILASQNALQGNSSKDKILNFCRAAITTKMKISGVEYENKFQNTLHPLWLDYIMNHSKSNPMDKMNINSICEYIRIVHPKIMLDTNRDKLKGMMKDLINLFQPLTWPKIIMNQDSIVEIAIMMHPFFPEIINTVFGTDCSKRTMHELNNL